MKRIIIIALMMASLASCRKANYYCYDQTIDNQGNVSASTTGLVKRYFANEADVMNYQHDNNKVCIEQH